MSLDHYSESLRYIILLKNFVNYKFLFKAIQSIEAGGNNHCCSSTDTTCCFFDYKKNQVTFKDPNLSLRSKKVQDKFKERCVSYDYCDNGWRC